MLTWLSFLSTPSQVSVAAASRAGTIRQMLHSGHFLESRQGEIRFPTIKTALMQETIRCLESLTDQSSTVRESRGYCGGPLCRWELHRGV